MQYYRFNTNPGCGGCLIWIIVFLAAVELFPGLLKILASAPLILFGLFWAFLFYAQRKAATYEAGQAEARKRFVHLLVNILVKIAQADGHFTKAELRTILNYFQYSLGYNQDQMYWVKQLIKEARDSTVGMAALLEEFRNTFGYEPRLILLELIFQLIHTQSPPDPQALNQAREIARVLEISSYDLRTIEAKYMYGGRTRYQESAGGGFGRGRAWGSSGRSYGGSSQGSGGSYGGGWGGSASTANQEDQYYAVLGLEPGASFEEIKKAYRKLVVQYHPDKVSHLGDEFKKVAEEKMKDINVAYDYFSKRFK